MGVGIRKVSRAGQVEYDTMENLRGVAIPYMMATFALINCASTLWVRAVHSASLEHGTETVDEYQCIA